MNHSILSSPSNLRKRPTDAADYVLGNEDWTKEQRFAPPMILSGSRDQFIEVATREHGTDAVRERSPMSADTFRARQTDALRRSGPILPQGEAGHCPLLPPLATPLPG